MKRLMILLPALLLLCGGCSLWKDAPPLEATESVQTLGVDLDGGVLVSVSTGSEDDAERISETGETLRTALDALRDRSKHGGLFYGHTQYLLLGEDFARAGVQELTDFTARSAELRLATPVYVLRGMAVDAVSDRRLDVTGQLGAIRRAGSATRTALDILDDLACSGAALLPALTYDADERTLRPDGCAVLADGKLAGFLDASEGTAAAWLSGTDGESIALPAGATVTVNDLKTAVSASWSGSRIESVRLTVRAEAAVEQAQDSLSISKESTRRALERTLAQEMAHRIAAAVARTQALRCDALGIGARLAGAYPLRWRAAEPEWRGAFPETPVAVTVQAKITDTQDLRDPIPQEGGA